MTLAEIVTLAVSKFQIPADRVWCMTLADIFLSLAQPEEKGWTADTQAGMEAVAADLDRRWQLMDKLTLDQKLELARWKAEQM